MTTTELERALRQGIARTVAVVGLAGVALIHLLDLPGKFQETPYMAWLYICLISGCVLAAVALVRTNDRRAWTAAALLPLGALVGFTLTRTVGLPRAMDDIGNWTEPLGLASLFVESSLVALACTMLTGCPAARRIVRLPIVPHRAAA